jgi:hypothetical protein
MTMDLVIKNQEFGFAVIAEESSVQVLIDPLVDPKYIAYIEDAVESISDEFQGKAITKEGLYAIIQEICKLVRYRVMSSK